MAALPERKIAIVRALVEAAPDKVVGSLRQALAQTADESALGDVRRLVESEVTERTLRNTILQPIAQMCVAGGDDPTSLTFPSRALALVWRGLRVTEAGAIEQAQAAIDDDTMPQAQVAIFDHLTAAAARGVRERSTDEFRAAAEVCDIARPNGADLLANCLDIATVVRRSTQRLPEWLAHPGGETTAAARLAYKDAVNVADDAGVRFFQMLAAQMAQPWMVLRVISAVMDKPTERYLADSELHGFAENLMGEIDQALKAIAGLNADAGAAAGRATAKAADLVIHQILEIETSIDLQRERGWGQRVHKQRSSLASVVEGRLREAEKVAMEALPMHHIKIGRARRLTPRLDTPPEPRLLGRAMTLLSFAHELRTTADYGGFSSTRAKLVEKLGEYMDHYVDEVLDLIRTHDVENVEIAAAFLETAAEFNLLVRGDKAAELVRRRAATALHPQSQMEADG